MFIIVIVVPELGFASSALLYETRKAFGQSIIGETPSKDVPLPLAPFPLLLTTFIPAKLRMCLPTTRFQGRRAPRLSSGGLNWRRNRLHDQT